MIWELTNPSDAIIIEHDNFKEAAFTALYLGQGKYGLEGHDSAPDMPIFLFGGACEWFEKTFGEKIEDTKAITAGVAAAFRGYLLGHPYELEIFKAAQKNRAPEEAREFREKWNENKRTSINDIVGYAYKCAEIIEAKLKEKEAAL